MESGHRNIIEGSSQLSMVCLMCYVCATCLMMVQTDNTLGKVVYDSFSKLQLSSYQYNTCDHDSGVWGPACIYFFIKLSYCGQLVYNSCSIFQSCDHDLLPSHIASNKFTYLRKDGS